MIRRILMSMAALALAGFLGFSLMVHLWERYQTETLALGFSGIYERSLAVLSGFPSDPVAYRAASADTAPAPMPAAIPVVQGTAAVEE
jgi:hypothetical protein